MKALTIIMLLSIWATLMGAAAAYRKKIPKAAAIMTPSMKAMQNLNSKSIIRRIARP